MPRGEGPGLRPGSRRQRAELLRAACWRATGLSRTPGRSSGLSPGSAASFPFPGDHPGWAPPAPLPTPSELCSRTWFAPALTPQTRPWRVGVRPLTSCGHIPLTGEDTEQMELELAASAHRPLTAQNSSSPPRGLSGTHGGRCRLTRPSPVLAQAWCLAPQRVAPRPAPALWGPGAGGVRVHEPGTPGAAAGVAGGSRPWEAPPGLQAGCLAGSVSNSQRSRTTHRLWCQCPTERVSGPEDWDPRTEQQWGLSCDFPPEPTGEAWLRPHPAGGGSRALGRLDARGPVQRWRPLPGRAPRCSPGQRVGGPSPAALWLWDSPASHQSAVTGSQTGRLP